MKWLQKIAAGICLVIGVPITLLVLVEFVNPSATDEDKGDALAALGILGVPPTALGAWFIYSLNRQHKKTLEQQERVRDQMFLGFLEAHQGTVNPLVFATQANLSLEDAKEYLDEKAVQLNGLYEATDDGGVVYRFPL